jgi:hypothetical protein
MSDDEVCDAVVGSTRLEFYGPTGTTSMVAAALGGPAFQHLGQPLQLRFTDSLDPLHGTYARNGPVDANHTGMRARIPGFGLSIGIDTGVPHRIDIRLEDSPHNFKAPESLRKLLNPLHEGDFERIPYRVLYGVVYPALTVLGNPAAVVRSNAIVSDGRTLILAGSSGAGKSSLGIALCREFGFSYLSEDFSFVSETGDVGPHHRWILLRLNLLSQVALVDAPPTLCDRLNRRINEKVIGRDPSRRVPLNQINIPKAHSSHGTFRWLIFLRKTTNLKPRIFSINHVDMCRLLDYSDDLLYSSKCDWVRHWLATGQAPTHVQNRWFQAEEMRERAVSSGAESLVAEVPDNWSASRTAEWLMRAL